MMITENEKVELTNRFGRYIVGGRNGYYPEDIISEVVLGTGRTARYCTDDLSGRIVILEIKELLCG